MHLSPVCDSRAVFSAQSSQLLPVCSCLLSGVPRQCKEHASICANEEMVGRRFGWPYLVHDGNPAINQLRRDQVETVGGVVVEFESIISPRESKLVNDRII